MDGKNLKVQLDTKELHNIADEMQAKYDEEVAKYNNRVTRKACLVIGCVAFVLGFLVKAMLF